MRKKLSETTCVTLPTGEYIVRIVKRKHNTVTLQVLEGRHDGERFCIDVPFGRRAFCLMAQIVKKTDESQSYDVKRLQELGFAPAALDTFTPYDNYPICF
jgi:hypothetical protein